MSNNVKISIGVYIDDDTGEYYIKIDTEHETVGPYLFLQSFEVIDGNIDKALFEAETFALAHKKRN